MLFVKFCIQRYNDNTSRKVAPLLHLVSSPRFKEGVSLLNQWGVYCIKSAVVRSEVVSAMKGVEIYLLLHVFLMTNVLVNTFYGGITHLWQMFGQQENCHDWISFNATGDSWAVFTVCLKQRKYSNIVSVIV